MITQPWALSTTEVIDKLETKPTGLTDKKAANRLLQYGNNTFHNKEKISVTALFLKQFLIPLIFLLLGAGVLTFILAELAETFVIALAVLLNVLLGFYHEYHAENTSVNDFSVVKAIVTGESMPVGKSEELVSLTGLVAERKNIAHAGSLVLQGY